ncbi:Hypothetical predicted protein [Marmota monax]|uniref:Uncharacterized protein n=1 Tax=Marmota monax TaxID=9995 RepID=A0A5E4AWM5_MARMO|nr:hypothetical protein GHT09_015785 [Marmota monax]VTJ61236.1 Hypothetical predicted protein [Marmota monax]
MALFQDCKGCSRKLRRYNMKPVPTRTTGENTLIHFPFLLIKLPFHFCDQMIEAGVSSGPIKEAQEDVFQVSDIKNINFQKSPGNKVKALT